MSLDMNMINELKDLKTGTDDKQDFGESSKRVTTTEANEFFDDDEIWNNTIG